MARVQRANVILQIEDYEVQHYMNMGYDLIDDSGAIISEAIPTNVGMLQKFYLEHTAKIAELEETVEKLTAQLSAKKTTAKKTTKAAE